MRLLLRYVSANVRRQHADVSPAGLRNILGGLGWLPTDETFAQQKLDEVIARMPLELRPQIAGANPILITTRPGTWGIVTTENKNRVFIRLLHDDLETLRSEAEEVVAAFPVGFEAEFERDLGFESEVVIRRFDSEMRLVAGEIQQLRTYGFWRYAGELRRRELWTFTALLVLAALALTASVATFLMLQHSIGIEYWRSNLDRAATALATGALTTVVNLVFEYRSWRNAKVRIKWAF